MTCTPSSPFKSSAICAAWGLSRTSTVISRSECSRPTETVTTSPISPSPSAIAPITLASWPLRWGIWTR
jgi:hypothetical protein